MTSILLSILAVSTATSHNIIIKMNRLITVGVKIVDIPAEKENILESELFETILLFTKLS